MNVFSPDRLCAIMEIKGKSDEEVGETVGVSRVSVHKWRSGLGYPSLPNLQGMCEMFGVNTNYFFPEQPKQSVTLKSKKGKEEELVGAK